MESHSEQPSSQSVLGDRDFRLFTSGHAVSAFGDAINVTALPLLVLKLTDSGARMGLVAMLQALPMLVFGLLAGVLADRWDRRRTMLWCDIGRTILVASIPASVMLDVPTMPVVYAVIVPIGVLQVLFQAASFACVPALVGRDRLSAASAYLSVASSVGYVVGPGLGGILVASIGAGYTLGVDAMTFAFSAACLALVRRNLRVEGASSGSMLKEIGTGLTFIVRHRVLRTVLAYWATVSFITAPLLVSVTFYITRTVGMSERALGYVVSVYAIGATFGALAGARVPAALAGYAMLGGSMVGGLAVIALGGIGHLGLALMIALFAGAGQSVSVVFFVTLRAQLTPDHLLGRVISGARVAEYGPQPLSLLVAGVLLDTVGGAATLWLIGGLSLAVSTAFWLLGGPRLAPERAA